MDLKNKVVLLTGAGGGIGQALAKKLASAGATLLLSGRDQTALNALRSELPGEHRVLAADINTETGRNALVEACRLYARPLDILINNAGVNRFGLFRNLRQSDLEALLMTNLVAPMLLTRALLPALLERNQGLIVNIGSTFGSIAFPGFAAYSATKFGLRGFTEALRRELDGSQVQVLYVAPRATRTAFNAGAVDDLNKALKTPTDKPDKVATAIVKAIQIEQAITQIGWQERLFSRINALMPARVDKALRKKLPVISRFAKQATATKPRADA